MIAIIVLACSVVSCKKYLDLTPPAAFDEAYTFSSVTTASKAVLGVYGILPNGGMYGNRVALQFPYDSDEIVNQETVNDYEGTAFYPNFQKTFDLYYEMIERANNCIKNIPAMEAYTAGTGNPELKRLHGEALALRALAYHDLIRFWGDVPAPFEPSLDQPTLLLPKTDRDTIYDRILNDLKLAVELVPWRGENGVGSDERLTKGAIKGLRARIALFRGGYSLRRATKTMERRPDYLAFYKIARDECADIMQRRDIHSLHPKFETPFKDFTMQYKRDPLGEIMFEVGSVRGSTSGISYYDGPVFKIPETSQQLGNGRLKLTLTYFYTFDSIDTRRDVTAAPYRVNADLTKSIQSGISIYSGKFRVDWLIPRPNSAVQQLGVDFPILRFSDILLMFAETENELSNGPSTAAISAFEEVRKRAYKGNENKIGVTPTDKDGFFQAIQKERMLEFGGEGLRKYDLIRWGIFAEKLAETKANLIRMQLRQAPYENLPVKMYVKQNLPTVIWQNSLYQPSAATTPSGYTAIAWTSAITTAYLVDFATSFEANKKELYPLPNSIIEANPNLQQDYGY
jgi:hypothetical protein